MGSVGHISALNSRDQNFFNKPLKNKTKEVIWEGARLLLFLGLSPKSQGQREELSVA